MERSINRSPKAFVGGLIVLALMVFLTRLNSFEARAQTAPVPIGPSQGAVITGSLPCSSSVSAHLPVWGSTGCLNDGGPSYNVSLSNISGNPELLTCTATASSTALACSSAGAFAAGQGIFIPHAGASSSLSTPSAPTVTNVSEITSETATIPASSPYTVTVAHGGSAFVKIMGLAYNGYSGQYGAFLNVGSLTPGLGEYSVSSAGVITFSAADAGRAVILGYFYNDTSGSATHTYAVAAIDRMGGESVASGVTTNTTSYAADLSTTHRNMISWASQGAVGYAVYRDGVLTAKVDDLPTWRPRWPYRVGDVVVPILGNGHQYVVTVDGMSGDAPPTFPTSAGASVAETPDGADGPDGSMGVTWQENGSPVVIYSDVLQAWQADFMTGFGGQSVYEPNIASTPPASALPDALVTVVSSVSGSTITLASAPSHSASSVSVCHDETAALQALLNTTTSNYLLHSVNFQFFEGMFRISSSLSIPSSGGSAIFWQGQAANGQYLNNAGYGANSWQIATTAAASPGGGSVLRATTALRTMLDFSSAGTGFTGSPKISDMTFIGYGVGQETGLDSQSQTQGGGTILSGPVISFATLERDNFYNLWQGVDLNLQWATIYRPFFSGDVYGYVTPASSAGVDSENQIDLFSPQAQGSGIAFVLRGGSSWRLFGGNYECNLTDILANVGELNLFSNATERCADPFYERPAIDLFSADAFGLFGGEAAVAQWILYGSQLSSYPGMVVRSGVNVKIQDADLVGEVRLGVSAMSSQALKGLSLDTVRAAGATPSDTTIFASANAKYVSVNNNSGAPVVSGGPAIVDQQLLSGGAPPTIYGCGASTPTTGVTGTFTSTSACSGYFKLQFAAPSPTVRGWNCWINDETTPADKFSQTAGDSVSATLSGTAASGDVLVYGCQPY